MKSLIQLWNAIPGKVRSVLSFLIKLVITVTVFYFILNQKVGSGEGGEKITALTAIKNYLPNIDLGTFWAWILVAMAFKAVGIAASIYRWYLLLKGQGIVFPMGHFVSTFLTGRFLGTFLPSTVGLDGYKLWDAA
ncbi:MAG: hypothetical protein ABH878_08225, partial [bacterium]